MTDSLNWFTLYVYLVYYMVIGKVYGMYNVLRAHAMRA